MVLDGALEVLVVLALPLVVLVRGLVPVDVLGVKHLPLLKDLLLPVAPVVPESAARGKRREEKMMSV